MSKMFSFAVVFILSFSLLGAEKAPLLVGRMDVPSLMSVTEDLSRISETVSPGSSLMLVMGLTALSFDPKMKDFDLASNISLYLYLFEKDKSQVVSWAVAFNKKTAGPLGKNDFGKNLFCKEFGDRAVLADSKELLDKLTEIPAPVAAASDDDEETGISLYFKPEIYLKNCGTDYLNVKNDFLSQFSMKYQKAGESGLMRSKATRVRLEYIEKFLSQISELKTNIRIKKDGVVFKLNLIPTADSQFNAFVKKQNGVKPELIPFAKDKNFVASGSFILTDVIRKSASDMFRDIAFEIADDEKSNGYNEIVDAIAKNSSGNFSLFVDTAKEKSWSDAVIKLPASKDGMKKLTDIFNKKYSSMKTGTDRFYKISDLVFGENKSLKTFCMLNDSDMLVYEGESDPAGAVKIIDDGFKNTEPVGDEYAGCFFVLKATDSREERANELTASFKNNSADLRLFITADTIRGFMPPEYLSKQKKKEKNRKRTNPM